MTTLTPAALAETRAAYRLAMEAAQSGADFYGVVVTPEQFAQAISREGTPATPAEWLMGADALSDTVAAICSDEIPNRVAVARLVALFPR